MQKSQRAKHYQSLFIADGIGKAKDLNCKIIFWNIEKF